MVKLKFKQWSNVGDVLTSEELKHVCGGLSSGSDDGDDCEPGVSNTLNPLPGQVEACSGGNNGSKCSFQWYVVGKPYIFTGTCKPYCINKKITLACAY